jgi:hypothetical protein
MIEGREARMSFARELSYIGVCARLRDGSAFFEVHGQFDRGTIRDLSFSSHNLFPPNGEVELRGISASTARLGDWFAFHVEAHGPPAQTKFRATEVSPLLPFEDLLNVGTGEAIRRLLVEDGRIGDFAGPRMVRISDREMIEVRVERHADGRWRVPSDPVTANLPVWEFRPELRVTLSERNRTVSLIDTHEPFQQIGTINWCSDAELVRRIVRAMHQNGPDDAARRQFADALLLYADQLEAGTASPNAIDSVAARAILRVRNIASVIKNEQDILQRYFDLLKSDPEVNQQIEDRIAAAVREEVVTETASISRQRTAELDKEIAATRSNRLAELEKSIGELGTEMMEGLDLRAAARLTEIESDLANKKTQGLADVEQAFDTKHRDLETVVSKLEQRRLSLLTEAASSEKKREELAVDLERLASQQALAIEAVERWTAVASALGSGSNTTSRINVSIPSLAPAPLPARQGIRVQDLEAEIAGNSLLTENGKKALLRFVALLLAGDVPVLYGPESDDFLEVAQMFISGGRCARLEADPTIICFDDLWIRAGTHVSTPLRDAIADACGETPRTQLCVISRADVSGARFWYPALADKSRRGDLPRRVLICATLMDKDSDEAKSFIPGCLLIEADGVIAAKASAVAPVILSGPNAKPLELDPGVRESDLTTAIQLLAKIETPLGVRDAERVARIYLAAGTLLKPPEAEEFARQAATQIAAVVASTVIAPARATNVVPLGGATRA